MTKPRANITEAQLKGYLAVKAERMEMQRQVDELKAREDALAASIADELRRCERTECKRGQHRVAFESHAGRVSWKSVAVQHLTEQQLADARAAVKPKRRLVVQVVSMLLLALLFTGCVKQAEPMPDIPFDDAPVVMDEPPVDFPAIEAPPPIEAEPQPIPLMIPQPAGAVCKVYSAGWCGPCQNLKKDLQWLAEKYSWTVSDDPNSQPDFLLVPRRDESQSIPFLEFWIDGRLVNSHLGYSDCPDFEKRKTELRQIVEKHPRHPKFRR